MFRLTVVTVNDWSIALRNSAWLQLSRVVLQPPGWFPINGRLICKDLVKG